MAMPAVDQRSRRRWSAREVRQLIAESALQTPRYELVDGELLVTPSPNRAHQLAVKGLLRSLDDYLATTRIGHVLPSPFDVELEPESITQPDVFVVSPSDWERLAMEMPARELVLAIEVLSPSSSQHDRVTKRPLYLRHVSEYWIVDPYARVVERWTPDEKRPEILTTTLEWHPRGAAEPFRLALPAFFASVFDENSIR
jgi:Uma2 family endonuclease